MGCGSAEIESFDPCNSANKQKVIKNEMLSCNVLQNVMVAGLLPSQGSLASSHRVLSALPRRALHCVSVWGGMV